MNIYDSILTIEKQVSQKNFRFIPYKRNISWKEKYNFMTKASKNATTASIICQFSQDSKKGVVIKKQKTDSDFITDHESWQIYYWYTPHEIWKVIMTTKHLILSQGMGESGSVCRGHDGTGENLHHDPW